MRLPICLPAITMAFLSTANPGHTQDKPQDTQEAVGYVVTYIESLPSARTGAAKLLRQYADASRKEPGNLRFDALQRIDRPNHFAIVGAWNDRTAAETHAGSASTKQFRDRLQPLLASAYDERPHTALSVGPIRSGDAKGTIYVVTHVDIIPTRREDGVTALRELSDPSRREKGNLRYEALIQNSRPNHFSLVEIWQNQKALEAHEAAAHTVKFRDLLLPMSGSLYDQRLYRALN